MSILVNVGASSAFDSISATDEALTQALKNFDNREPHFILLFASPTKYDQATVLQTIKKRFPNTLLVGCSSAGEISSSNGTTDNSLVLMAIYSDQLSFEISKTDNITPDSKAAGINFAESLLQKKQNLKPQACLIFPDGLNGNGSELLNGITQVFGSQTLIAGGSAGDDFLFKKTFQYINNEVLSEALVGVGIYGKFNFGIGVRHGWIPIGSSRVVTKSVGNIVQELDCEPAIAIYEDQFGKDKTIMRPDEPFAKLAITYPLGIATPGEREFLIRDPLSVNQNGEIVCAADVPMGSEVYMMIGSREEAIMASRDAAHLALAQLNGTTPKAAILISCIARKKLLMNKRKDEIDEIRKIIGMDVPLIGFYSYGEQAPSAPEVACSFHNETNVIFLLGE